MKKTLIVLRNIIVCLLVVLGTVSCGNSTKKTVKSIMDSGLEEHVIQNIVTQATSIKGNNGDILILIEGTPYLITPLQGQEKVETFVPPDCSVVTCNMFRTQISKLCIQSDFPPETPILIYVSPDEVCYCFCGSFPKVVCELKQE